MTYGHKTSWAQRLDELDARLEAMSDALPPFDGAYVDVVTKETVLVLPPSADRARFDAVLKAEQAATRSEGASSFRVRVDPASAADTHKGGLRLRSCTSAFTVRNKNTGARRYVTAAHCTPPQKYKRWGSAAWERSTFHGKKHGANADLAWYSADTRTVRPRYYGAVRSGAGVLQRARGIAGVGSWICHAGKVTGYSCGRVTSKNYKPTYVSACPGGPCNASFVRVYSSNLQSKGGDSGGPWYRDGVMFGVHKGDGISDITGRGGPAWYSKITYLPPKLELLT